MHKYEFMRSEKRAPYAAIGRILIPSAFITPANVDSHGSRAEAMGVYWAVAGKAKWKLR